MKTVKTTSPVTLFATVTLLFVATFLQAQIKMGDNPTSINVNSLLELESTNKGLLLPRLTTAQMNGMTNPPKGMMLFNTSDSSLYVRRDSGWVAISMSAAKVASGNSVSDFGSGVTFSMSPLTQPSADKMSFEATLLTNGNVEITEAGVCYGKNPKPTVNDFVKTNVLNAGSVNISALGNTVYYARPYATNGNEVVYGQQVKLTTTAGLATVNVKMDSIKSTTAVANVSIPNPGGGGVTSFSTTTLNFYIYYPNGLVAITGRSGPSNLPVTANTNFTYTLIGLSPGTTYHLVAKVQNSYGTAVSDTVHFTTKGYGIGDTAYGGIVCYTDSTGEHGRVMAFTDSSLSFGGNNVNVLTTTSNYPTGNLATATLVAAIGTTTNYAARYCSELVLNGYNDWYLPTQNELSSAISDFQNRSPYFIPIGVEYVSSTSTTKTTCSFVTRAAVSSVTNNTAALRTTSAKIIAMRNF